MTARPCIQQQEKYPYKMTCRECGESWIPTPNTVGSLNNGLPVLEMSEVVLHESASFHWRECRSSQTLLGYYKRRVT